MARFGGRWKSAGLLGLALSCLPDVDVPTPLAPKACGDGIVQLSLGEECDPGAGGTGCSTDCRTQCDAGLLDPVTNHCYFGAASSYTLQQARQSCKALGGHLVRFVGKSEVVLVSGQMLDGSTPGWLDLEREEDAGALAAPFFRTDDGSEPGWRNGVFATAKCSGCYAINGNPLAENFPVPEGGLDGPAVVFSRDVQYTWFAAPYTLMVSLPVVCEREPPGKGAGPCEAGTCIELAPTRASKLYVLQTSPAKYSDAQSTCTSAGGTLVIVQTPEEREELTRALAQANVASAWIGLTATQPDAWTWANGKTIASGAYIDPWGENEPPKGFMGAAYLRIDASAYDTRLAHTDALASMHPFVCEIAL